MNIFVSKESFCSRSAWFGIFLVSNDRSITQVPISTVLVSRSHIYERSKQHPEFLSLCRMTNNTNIGDEGRRHSSEKRTELASFLLARNIVQFKWTSASCPKNTEWPNCTVTVPTSPITLRKKPAKIVRVFRIIKRDLTCYFKYTVAPERIGYYLRTPAYAQLRPRLHTAPQQILFVKKKIQIWRRSCVRRRVGRAAKVLQSRVREKKKGSRKFCAMTSPSWNYRERIMRVDVLSHTFAYESPPPLFSYTSRRQ